MSVEELLQKVLYTEGANRVELARKSLNRALEELPRFDIPKDNYGIFIVALIKLFVRADRNVSFEEYSFVREVIPMHLTSQEFIDRMNSTADDGLIIWVDNLIDRFSPEGKEAACTFGLCIMESDDVLTREEYEVFSKLLK